MDQAGLVAGFPVLGRLSPDDLARLSAAARPVRFGPRERIFSEGQRAEGCWLIHDGQVALDVFVPGRGDLGPGRVEFAGP